jgi:hypothetical protein
MLITLMQPFLNSGYEKKASEVSGRTFRTAFLHSVPMDTRRTYPDL